MNYSDFSDSLGGVFQVGLPEGEPQDVTLKELGKLKPPPESAPQTVRRDPFYLVFESDQGEQLPTGVLDVTSPDGVVYQLTLHAEGHIDNDQEKGISYYVVVN